MSVYPEHISSWKDNAVTLEDAEALARQLYERVCRGDSFDDLKRRSAFDRQNAGRLRHWILVANDVLADGLRRRP